MHRSNCHILNIPIVPITVPALITLAQINVIDSAQARYSTQKKKTKTNTGKEGNCHEIYGYFELKGEYRNKFQVIDNVNEIVESNSKIQKAFNNVSNYIMGQLGFDILDFSYQVFPFPSDIRYSVYHVSLDDVIGFINLRSLPETSSDYEVELEKVQLKEKEVDEEVDEEH